MLLASPAKPINAVGSQAAQQAIHAWQEIGASVMVQDVPCAWRELRA
jgi:hypothetical protein